MIKSEAAKELDEGWSRQRSPSLYFDQSLGREAAKIQPGECYVTALDMVLVTVLGSCVSACIRDPVARIGGLNHFMLPEATADESVASQPMRYGVYAMEVLINDILRRGARRDRLEAKVAGGGNVLRGFGGNTVGDRNAAFVTRFLEAEGIRVLGSDLGGGHARKIYYFPASGRLRCKTLQSVQNDTLDRREREYRARLAKEGHGQIELFG
ncbi:MAG TPA: chemoreceptor glutamine deamidase CheD [Burkholderiales bacterium]|nr:chemoreceptor glutamine deamidase CheD [Burkholderiales bacterium]